MKSHDPYRPRCYIHFDEPLPREALKAIAEDPKTVAAWAFLPFLRYMHAFKRIKRPSNQTFEPKLKERPICYAAHKDAAIYAHYSETLSEAYEIAAKHYSISDSITAFRRKSGQSNIHFAKEAFDWIAKQDECVALAFDVESFFDNLDHKVLKQQWKNVLNTSNLPKDHFNVFKSLTRYSYADRKEVFSALGISSHNPYRGGRRRLCSAKDFREKIRGTGLIAVNTSNKGIPQGSPLSATLSNIYMLNFDIEANKMINSVNGFYKRYCDDILCVVPREYAERTKKFVMNLISEVKLTIQESKTSEHHFIRTNGALTTNKPLQYLGFNFDGHSTLLRNSGIGRYYSRMRSGVRLAASTTAKANKENNISDGLDNPIRRKKLNVRYSYLGRSNYLSYAFRSSRIMNQSDQSPIKNQVRGHWKKLNREVKKRQQKLNDQVRFNQQDKPASD